MAGRLAIDFGTSNTVIAVWDESLSTGKSFHLSNYGSYYQQGNERISIIPSLINYSQDNRRWLGQQVRQRNLEKHEQTFRWVKRYIANPSPIKRKIHSGQISYQEAGKDFLSTVLIFAAQELNLGNEEVAFTVPVEAFEDYENWLTEVAQTAGMPRFRLIDEASAAALGYGANIQAGDVYLIFDFGGGTLDIAVVLIEEEDFSASRRCRVLGKAGCNLGGATIGSILNPNTGGIIGAEFTRSLKDRVMLSNPLDAVARGGAAFVAGVDFYDHIQHDYALRYFNGEKGEYDYRILVKRGTNYPTESIARLTIKASHDGQEHLGLAIFELGQQYQSNSNNNIELVFDPNGSARLSSISADVTEDRSYFWMNEE